LWEKPDNSLIGLKKMTRARNNIKFVTNHKGINITVMGKNLKHCASKVRRIIKNIDNGYYQELANSFGNTL